MKNVIDMEGFMDDLMTQIGLSAGAITIVTLCIVGFFSLLSLAFSLWIIRYVRRSFFGNQDLASNGIPTQATVLQAWQTGAMVNYNPQIGLRLQVQHPQGNTYEVETKAVVPQLQLAQLQIGAVVPVRIDPDNPQRVLLAI
jgi:hypothetical protein